MTNLHMAQYYTYFYSKSMVAPDIESMEDIEKELKANPEINYRFFVTATRNSVAGELPLSEKLSPEELTDIFKILPDDDPFILQLKDRFPHKQHGAFIFFRLPSRN